MNDSTMNLYQWADVLLCVFSFSRNACKFVIDTTTLHDRLIFEALYAPQPKESMEGLETKYILHFRRDALLL